MKCAKCGAAYEGRFCPQCGTPAEGEPGDGQTAAAEGAAERSRFTGGAFANFGINFLTVFVTLITLSLAYPAMKCWKMRWEVRHTYINGRQLTFDGKAGQLFGKYVLWLLLSVITLGIYYLFCMSVNLVKWETKHTHVSGVQGGESEFTGGALGYFGVNFVCGLVTVVTLTFGMYWAKCHKERWLAKHKVIDGYRMAFDGKAMQYFGKRIVWTLLTVVTLLIYSFWLAVKSKQWIIKHTVFAAGQQLPAICNGSESDPAKLPKGPEYWGDLEESFKTKENAEVCRKIQKHGLITAALTISLIMTVIFILAAFLIIVATLADENGPVENIYVFIPFLVFEFILFIPAVCNAKGSFAKISENTTIGQVTRAKRMLVLLTIGLVFLPPVFIQDIVAAHRLGKIKRAAKNYFLSKGTAKGELKSLPLGEFYVKLDKYNEYLKYQKFEERRAKALKKSAV